MTPPNDEPKEKKKEQKINLNKTVVENLPFAKSGTYNVMDAKLQGFGIRMYATTKTYFVYTRIKGRLNSSGRHLEIRESIGRHGIIKFEDARSKAKEILEDAAIGITPDDRIREKENLKKIEESKGATLEDVFKDYLAWNKQLKDSTRGNYRLHIDAYLPDWKDRPIRDITVDDVQQRHVFLSKKIELVPAPPYIRKSRKKTGEPEVPRPKKEKIRANGPGVANATMKILRAVINYAISSEKYKHIISENPVKLGKGWNILKDRENFITPDQLPSWFKAVNESKHPTVKDALLLLLFTGVRSKKESFALKWSDIDWTSKIITFNDTKNSTTLRLPMSTYVYDLLKSRKDAMAGPESGYVFEGKSKLGNISDIRKELAKINKKTGTSISPHDLRRTFLTYADDDLGISLLTLKALVNHESNKGNKDVTAKYIKVPMFKRVKAMQAITDHILITAKANGETQTNNDSN